MFTLLSTFCCTAYCTETGAVDAFRPHQGRGNRPLSILPPGKGKVRRLAFLGGLLNHYYREAG